MFSHPEGDKFPCTWASRQQQIATVPEKIKTVQD